MGLANVSMHGGQHHRAGDSQKGNGWQTVAETASVPSQPLLLPVSAAEEEGKTHKGKKASGSPTARPRVSF